MKKIVLCVIVCNMERIVLSIFCFFQKIGFFLIWLFLNCYLCAKGGNFMQNEELVTIRWRENDGKEFSGKFNRADFLLLMSRFAKEYPHNNEISSAFLIYSDFDEIFIDERLNNQKEIPVILLKKQKDVVAMIQARRNNKMIWSIFNMMKSIAVTRE